VANHPSALKRHRQSEKRRLRNRAIKTRLRHLVREVRTALSSKDANAAAKTLTSAARALDKAVTKGVLHRNNAARKISRLARAVSELRGGAAGASVPNPSQRISGSEH
jgi:small subunit ribosomal protein S20